jgi:peptidoglycan/LPS O-acetylase OafA/YrhL
MTELATNEARAEGRFRAGDPMRAIAALSVAVYHAAYLGLVLNGVRPTEFDAYGDLGGVLHALDLGLYIFFVLSGYLIARPFVRAYVTGSGSPEFFGYARNRLLRIVPAFWVVYTLMLLAWGTRGDSVGEIAAVYGFAQLFEPGETSLYVGPAWTLGVELSFYLLVPVAALIAARLTPRWWDEGHRLKTLVVVCAAVAITSLALRQLGPETIAFHGSFPTLAFAFVPGVLLAAAEMRYRPSLDASRARVVSIVALAVGAAAMFAAALVGSDRVGFDPAMPMSRPLLAVVGAGCFLAAALVHEWGGRDVSRLLVNPVLMTLGLWSYSIYLIHQGFLGVGLDYLWDGWGPRKSFGLALLTGLPLVVLAAAASFYVVERPALERRVPWRRRSRKQKSERVAAG